MRPHRLREFDLLVTILYHFFTREIRQFLFSLERNLFASILLTCDGPNSVHYYYWVSEAFLLIFFPIALLPTSDSSAGAIISVHSVAVTRVSYRFFRSLVSRFETNLVCQSLFSRSSMNSVCFCLLLPLHPHHLCLAQSRSWGLWNASFTLYGLARKVQFESWIALLN